jgi:sortase A
MRRLSGLLVGMGFMMAGTGVAAFVWSVAAQHQAAWTWTTAFDVEEPESATALVRLSCPRLNQAVLVMNGATERNLLSGPAILEGTGRPGAKTNCIIAGHRDTHFRFLKDVQNGDELLVERGRKTYRYRVTSMHIVDPTNTNLLRPESSAVLTLVTCYPFFYVGPAPQRFIVRAELLSAG